jgi:SAM-dependent methyltransferase
VVYDREGECDIEGSIDNSSALVEIAKRSYPEADIRVGDATALPYGDRTFDIAFSFAVVHHIPSDALRRRFIAEASRVLAPGATFVLTAWDLWRPKYLLSLLRTAIASTLFLSPLDCGDMMHVFGTERTPRYLHAFTKRELRRLLSRNGFEVIGEETLERASGSRERNLLFVCRKR